MPQARLPDINTAFTKHRNEVMTSLKSANYDSAMGSLYSLNGLLPDTLDKETNKPQYRVIISDIEYDKLTKPEVTAECYHCEKSSLSESFKVFDLLLPINDQILIGRKTMKVWKCPLCKEICQINKTEFAEKVTKEPHFVGVVPKPPRKQDNLSDRKKYHTKFKQWALTFLAELEAKMAQFRDDNWNQGDDKGEGEEMDYEGGEDDF